MDFSIKTCLFMVMMPHLMLVSTIVTRPTAAQNSHDDYLRVHNEARKEVGVPPLVWNTTVASYAQSYANRRTADCALEHSMGPYGENIAEGGSDSFSGVDAVKMWVGEKPFYDYASNSCVGNQECLHYTQVVWRDSVHLGCARAECANGWRFVTCNYDPPGNYQGQRPY